MSKQEPDVKTPLLLNISEQLSTEYDAVPLTVAVQVPVKSVVTQGVDTVADPVAPVSPCGPTSNPNSQYLG